MQLGEHQLRVLGVVARCGSVTAAAERLSISQPAVSKQIKLLERLIGTRLIERAGRGIALTEAGHVLAEYAHKIEQLVAEAEEAVSDLQSLRRGKLFVAAAPSIAAYLLPPVLVRFRLKYPGVRLKVEIAQSAALFQRLQSDEKIDFALTEVEPPNDTFEFQTFMRDTFVPIATFGHALSKQRTVAVADFVREGLILRDDSAGRRSFVEEALRAEGIALRPILRLNSTEAVKEAVAAGLGVAFVSEMAVRSDCALRRLSAIPVKRPVLRRPAYRVSRPGSTQSKATIAFLYMLKHAVRASLPSLRDRITPAV